MKLSHGSYLVCLIVLFSGVIPEATAQHSISGPVEMFRPDGAPASAANSRGPWWKRAVFYEIFPRSFQDTNGDGIGDLNGITQRLDYLKSLGIDAIWITPCFRSPLIDYGYDVGDYNTIGPEFGTLADFDRLIAQAKKRNIRVLLDFVVNHTSDQHSWFRASSSSRSDAKRDWYIWRDGKGEGKPPTNWQSGFLTPAWTYDQTTAQWYFHSFWPEQPDLNWRNPEVRKAMFDVMRFWLGRGAAGFRLDAVPSMFEDPQLRDDPNDYDRTQDTHEALRQMNLVAREFVGDRVLLGETFTKTAAELAPWYGKGDELNLALNFPFDLVNKVSAPEYRKRIEDVEKNLGGQPTYFLNSHDEIRAYDRFGDGQHNDQIAKLMAALMLTVRGTPVMYYGEEIGMKTTTPTRREDARDMDGVRNWPRKKGRDGERTPMQWTSAPNAGFTTGTPWLPIPATSESYNVEAEERKPDSILHFYRALLAIRRNQPALNEGAYVGLLPADPNLLVYLRRPAGTASSVLVVLNMSANTQTLAANFAGTEEIGTHVQLLLRSGAKSYPSRRTPIRLGAVTLKPFEAVLIEVSK